MPEDYELLCNDAVSKTPAKFDDISTVKIEEVYYKLNKKKFPSIDSFIIMDNNYVVAFQITITEKKKVVKGSGLQEKKLLNCPKEF